MINKKTLILSIVTFALTCLAFVYMSYAWITIAKDNQAGGIEGDMTDINCDHQMYLYKNDTWVLCNEKVAFENFIPGRIEYFKLVITSRSNDEMDIKVNYGIIESMLTNELLYSSENNTIYVTDRDNNDLVLYDVDQVNNNVLFNDQILYRINNNLIGLDYYKIQNVISSYTLPDDNLSITGLTKNTLNDPIIDNVTLGPRDSLTDTTTIYFALEFDEDLLLIDNIDYSNCYCYQKFIINNIEIVSK